MYKLNADIRKEIRCNNNWAVKVKQLINNFKASYPRIIDNLRNDAARDNSDVTKNTTVTSNAPTIQYKPINKISRVVNSTTDISNTTLNETNQNKLKTVTDHFNIVIGQTNEINDICMDSTKYIQNISNNGVNDEIGCNKNMHIDEDSLISYKKHELSKRETFMNYHKNRRSTPINFNEPMNHETCSSDNDSDLSQACTEIIVECDVHNNDDENINTDNASVQEHNTLLNTDSVDDDTCSYISASDEVLMEETIYEINKELNKKSDEVLTPPPGFRDN